CKIAGVAGRSRYEEDRLASPFLLVIESHPIRHNEVAHLLPRHDRPRIRPETVVVTLTPRISHPPGRRQICACTFDDWLVGRLHAFVRRRLPGRVSGPP